MVFNTVRHWIRVWAAGHNNRWRGHPKGARPLPRNRHLRGISIIVLLGLVLTGCGPSRKAQCLDLFDTIQAADDRRVLGDPSRAAILETAQVYETLAAELQTLELRDNTLVDYRDQFVDGYQAIAQAMRDRAEVVDEDGTYGYIAGDTASEQTFNTLQANERRAHNRVITTLELYSSYCDR